MDSVSDYTALSRELDLTVKPSRSEKVVNAEVTTPYMLRQLMLDLIPESFWTIPRLVYEPCAGKGGFLIDIVERFMIGLKDSIPNQKERYRIIVEKCLYFGDINDVNIAICRQLLNNSGVYKLNYHQGDTLELDIHKKWKIQRFDLIVANPPYTTSQHENVGSSMPLYNLFLLKYIDLSDHVVFVMPSRWFVRSHKGLGDFRKAIQARKDIECIIHVSDSREWFKGVVIKGGCCILYKNNDYNGYCKLNGSLYDLSATDLILPPHKLRIIALFEQYKNVKSIMSNTYTIETTDPRINETEGALCLVSKIKSPSMYSYITGDHNSTTWKVVISRTALKTNKLSGMYILEPGTVYTRTYMGFNVANRKEAESLVSYLRTRLVYYIVRMLVAVHTISASQFKHVPLVPLDRLWTDDSVYAYFELKQDDIDIIEQD